MKVSKKAITGMIIGAVLIIAVPISVLAVHFSREFHRFPKNLSLNPVMQQFLSSKGVSFPTADEMQKFQTGIMQARFAMSKLSVADREYIEKATRDAMRAKWIQLPSEEEYTKIQQSMDQAKVAWDKLSLSEKASLMRSSSYRMHRRFEGRRQRWNRWSHWDFNDFKDNRDYNDNFGFGFGMMNNSYLNDNDNTPLKSNAGITTSSTGTTTGTGVIK